MTDLESLSKEELIKRHKELEKQLKENENISSAIAIVTAIPGALVPPALLRIVQPVVSVSYIKMEDRMRKLFKSGKTVLEQRKEETREKKIEKKEGTIGELGEGEG